MRSTRIGFSLLIGAAVVAAVVAAAAGSVPLWASIAAACGFLALVMGLRLVSLRLWQLSADLKEASSGVSRTLAPELHSMQVILNRFPECSLPTTGFSMTFGNLHALMDLLDELEPETVVEFGSGISTVMVAAWMNRRGRGLIHSFDHDRLWADKTSRHLVTHGLSTHCHLSCVPLAPISVQGQSVNWYRLPDDVRKIEGIDLVIVDGPPSHQQPMARMPALFALKDRLSDEYCIVLDDAMRPEETAVAAVRRRHLPDVESYTIGGLTGLAIFRRRAIPTPGAEAVSLTAHPVASPDNQQESTTLTRGSETTSF